MPTRDHPHLIELAIHCFLAQTHQDKTLHILDDGDLPGVYGIPRDPRIVYTWTPAIKATLGAKLNAMARAADAPILCNWDDDDWSSHDRLEHQLQTLTNAQAQMTGFTSIYYWDETTLQAHVWEYKRGNIYACGSSQMYTREWALAHPMLDRTLAVDWYAAEQANKKHALAPESGLPYLIARYHHMSTWQRNLAHSGMPAVHAERLPAQFFSDRATVAQSRPCPARPTLTTAERPDLAPGYHRTAEYLAELKRPRHQ